MVSTNDLKNGMTIEYNGELLEIIYFQHVKPGKGAAFVRTKIKNMKTGQVFEKTFRAGEKLNRATIERKTMQYLYSSEDTYYFMDTQTFEQISLSEDQIGIKNNI